MYNCFKANVRLEGGSAARWINKVWLSFQELRKEWKLFFNYCTASGREHRKPQYLELWSADTHIHLDVFQEEELDWGTVMETISENSKRFISFHLQFISCYSHCSNTSQTCVTVLWLFQLKLWAQPRTTPELKSYCDDGTSSGMRHDSNTLFMRISTHNKILRALVEMHKRKMLHI